MHNPVFKAPSFLVAIISILGWFALAGQLYLIIQNRVVSVPETIIRYFSFFTILTNFIVAICATVLWAQPATRLGGYFLMPAVVTAITVYITVVGVVYNVILRFLWQPQGLQMLIDELLHSVIPFLFILLWIIYVPKTSLQYRNALRWQLYPVIYIIYTAIHGAITGFYPYPFVNVTALGYTRVFINALGLVVVFMGLSLFCIAVGKYINRKNIQAAH